MRRYKDSSKDYFLVKDAMGPNGKLRDILPKTLRDIIYDAKKRSTRIKNIHVYFLKFTDRWDHVSSEEVCHDLFLVNRFLQSHLYTHSHSEQEDDSPILLFHAFVPELMLDVLRQCFTPEFDISDPSTRRLPYLSMQILSYFVHRKSQTFLLAPDRIFHDCAHNIGYLVEVLHGGLSWFESIAVSHIFMMFSYCPAGVVWFQSHPDVIERACRLTYRATEIIDEKIGLDEVSGMDKGLSSLLHIFRDHYNLKMSAKLLGLLCTNHAIVLMVNLLEKSLPDYEKFLVVSGAVREARVLTRFSSIVKCVMTWITPGKYLTPLLSSVQLMLGTHRGVEDLFLDELIASGENNRPVGIETFKYWSHESCHPAPLAIYLLHALALDSTISCSDWCIFTLCHLLREGEVTVAETILKHYGHELLDLAHLLEIHTPRPFSVQSVILEALLRYGGFTHKLFNYEETFEGTVKPPDELPDFCLEAALFVKKAQCEERMTLEEKQRRVVNADSEKDQGNGAFKDGKFNEAIIKYTNAIAICPLSARTKQSVYYSNRAECYLRVNDAKRAIHDCNRALCLDKTARVKVQWRRSRAFKQLNLDYPAWLDMKCLESEWRRSQGNTGVNFQQILSSFGEQVGALKPTLFTDTEIKLSAVYY